MKLLPEKIKIFYVTASDISLLGAPRSSDIPLVMNLLSLNYDLTWIGINLDSYKKYNGKKISLRISTLEHFLSRIIKKVLRVLRIQTIEDQKLYELIKFDKWVAKELEKNKSMIDQNLIFIGRAVSSKSSFEVIKRYGGKCVLNSQWMHPDKHKNVLDNELSRLKLLYTQVLAKRVEIQKEEIEICDRIWCFSKLVYDSYIHSKISENKLFFCPLGVDNNIFKPDIAKRSLEKGISEDLTIIFVGNINVEKGVHILLNSLLKCHLKKCKVILNGAVAGFFKDFLEEYSEKLLKKNIEVIIKKGFPLSNYQKADLFILPSLHESFGLTVLESMASGLPVIVSDEVGASQHVLDGENGFIIPAGSVDELTKKINFFYDFPEKRILFGKKSREISEKLDWNFIAKQLMEAI